METHETLVLGVLGCDELLCTYYVGRSSASLSVVSGKNRLSSQVDKNRVTTFRCSVTGAHVLQLLILYVV